MTITRGSGLRAGSTAEASTTPTTDRSAKENGKVTRLTGRPVSSTQTAPLTVATMLRERKRAKASLFGRTRPVMRENSMMISFKASVPTFGPQAKSITESGREEPCMGEAICSFRMADAT